MNKIFEHVEQRRIELGMSARKLCLLSDINESTYRNWIHGRSDRADVEAIRRLAFSLNMSVDELFAHMDGAPSPAITEEMKEVYETPATTQEVDTGFAVLLRTMEANSTKHIDELKLLQKEFDEAISARDAQFKEFLRSKDEQTREERQHYIEQLNAKDRSIKQLLTCVVALVGVLCATMIILAFV